jgi:hypothetical protein
MSEPVDLRWFYIWWPDGMTSELDRIAVVYQGEERGEVNVGALLRQSLARSLAEVVIEELAGCCAKLTGKPIRAMRRRASITGTEEK